ncbi:DUF4400 domain-containing protein [Methylocaldum sp. BRCS4]|uniref:DUF4400 domain-containing protein n=1 Tax=Methylocaldum sp. 14B TaxID=1912213 RepID=UPI00098AD5F1|nr:DUF4400 domain-containing protein [Methylocaldum sp. 14B]MVF23675.1 DUF4400 domain-containing protein [Methylocaldum sp. BRCS4]
MLLSWWPFLLATVVPFAVDGLAQRSIKQSNFDYSSPLAHRYSFFAMLGILYVLLLGLTPCHSPCHRKPCRWLVWQSRRH